MTKGRAALIGCGGLFLILGLLTVAIPEYLMSKGRRMGIESTNRIFTLAQQGQLDKATEEDLISDSAVASLKSVGDGSGKFSSFQAKVEAVQASGVPCVMTVEARQGRKAYRFQLFVDWGYCGYAFEEP